MFKDSEIKAVLVEETKGTNENQPLKYLTVPRKSEYRNIINRSMNHEVTE
jgi:hypothetical protein